jgi:hypothetical protein
LSQAPSLVDLRHSSGALMHPIETTAEGHVLYLCSRERCPHWAGQPGLPGMPSAAVMWCALVGYAPTETCQAEYMDRVVSMSDARKALWDRLADAEALERRRQIAAAARRSAD